MIGAHIVILSTRARFAPRDRDTDRGLCMATNRGNGAALQTFASGGAQGKRLTQSGKSGSRQSVCSVKRA
jgi:hypothetical protein